jgi:hypothetical protein
MIHGAHIISLVISYSVIDVIDSIAT